MQLGGDVLRGEVESWSEFVLFGPELWPTETLISTNRSMLIERIQSFPSSHSLIFEEKELKSRICSL